MAIKLLILAHYAYENDNGGSFTYQKTMGPQFTQHKLASVVSGWFRNKNPVNKMVLNTPLMAAYCRGHTAERLRVILHIPGKKLACRLWDLCYTVLIFNFTYYTLYSPMYAVLTCSEMKSLTDLPCCVTVSKLWLDICISGEWAYRFVIWTH